MDEYDDISVTCILSDRELDITKPIDYKDVDDVEIYIHV